MIIEKTITDNSYNINKDDYVAEGELTVTITLSEYRELIEKRVENKLRKEHESWLEQYNRANKAESRVKELEDELNALYKRMSMPVEECAGEQNDN